MSSKHTPGPWHVEPGKKPVNTDCRIISASDGLGPVAFATDENARLIAAAPTQHDVLCRAYKLLANVTHQWPGRHTPEGQKLLVDMRDAIALGDGRNPEDIQDEASATGEQS